MFIYGSYHFYLHNALIYQIIVCSMYIPYLEDRRQKTVLKVCLKKGRGEPCLYEETAGVEC